MGYVHFDTILTMKQMQRPDVFSTRKARGRQPARWGSHQSLGDESAQSPQPEQGFQVRGTEVIGKIQALGPRPLSRERTGSVTHGAGDIVYPRMKEWSWTLVIHQLQKFTHNGKTKM